MRTKLGILGPEDSIMRIKEVAEKMTDLDVLYFPYEHAAQSESIIRENNHKIDHWFLSGPALYHYLLRKNLINEENASFPDLYGASLMGSIVEMMTTSHTSIKRVSLDTIQKAEMERVRSEFAIEKIAFTLYGQQEFLPAEDVIAFHKDLYEQGKVDAVMTCIKTVHLKMKELGIPCFRISPSRLSIELELRYIREYGQANWYRKSSLGIVGVEVNAKSLHQEQQFYSYKIKQQILDLKRLLLNFSEQVQGSFVEVGDGLFFIYSTRGELEVRDDHFLPAVVLDDMEKQTGLSVHLGIGYGMTAWGAEQNVRHALRLSSNDEEKQAVLVDEEKKVTLYKNDERVSYQERILGDEWNEKLKEAKLSPAVVSKLSSYYRHYGREAVTANDIAGWLKSSDRNARRILMELERLNLAAVKGEEAAGQRGRPKKVYELYI
ncbi:hypothetical protein [Alkalihalobacillus sp. CinArs1]|uniref:hypothetical protein n=1 Tax=Alkalihalobacillus sp. CinArs1 TaxID=2995314 RepID=UPI0022DD290E|nr:hypothetical protein [Alkalihalobacillus sp. CinArs1]